MKRQKSNENLRRRNANLIRRVTNTSMAEHEPTDKAKEWFNRPAYLVGTMIRAQGEQVEHKDMDTERMIRELRRVADKHVDDKLMTFDTNITAMCMDVIPKLEVLKQYENTGLTPEQIREIDQLYSEKCRELVECRKKQDWIPVSERLPKSEKYEAYLCTIDGELCGIEEPFTGLCGYEKGKWDEDCIIAWMPLPEPYKEEKY